jgi:glycosyltransferase involved in cell wall biosynthesis
VLPRLDFIVFVSDYMRLILTATIPDLERVPYAVIPNFCAPVVRTDAVLSGDLISVGTLEPRKNQKYLIQVLAEAKRLGHEYSLALVGDGPDRDSLAVLAKRLDVAEQVRFLGYQASARQLLSSYRCYVHSALIENLSIVLLEALAAGRPILAPAVGGLTEIFVNEREGLFWPLENPVIGAKMLISVLEDAEKYRSMSEAGYQRFMERFSTDVVAGRLVEVLANG